MVSTRRFGAEQSQVRAQFVDAAEAILIDVGERGISARLVAERAGLKTQLLYYYFRTMDDLLRAVIQRLNERRVARFHAALAAPEPLRALWVMMIDPSAAALAAAVSSLASHRPAVREDIITAAQAFRVAQTQAVQALLPPQIEYSPEGIVMIAASLARMMVHEATLGLTEGHSEAISIVEDMLRRASRRAPSPRLSLL